MACPVSSLRYLVSGDCRQDCDVIMYRSSPNLGHSFYVRCASKDLFETDPCSSTVLFFSKYCGFDLVWILKKCVLVWLGSVFEDLYAISVFLQSLMQSEISSVTSVYKLVAHSTNKRTILKLFFDCHFNSHIFHSVTLDSLPLICQFIGTEWSQFVRNNILL